MCETCLIHLGACVFVCIISNFSSVCFVWFVGVCHTLKILRCKTLQHTTTRCITPFVTHLKNHTAALYNTLQHAALHCNTLEQTAAHCYTHVIRLVVLATHAKNRNSILTCRIHIHEDTPHSCVWHVSFTCVACLIHMCDMPHLYAWHAACMCVIYLNHMCGMPHSCA